MSKEGVTVEQVKEMAKLTILADRISEVQEKNLRLYPFVFLNDVKAVTIDYDLRDRNSALVGNDPVNHRVTYRIELDRASNEEHLEKRLLSLEAAVRTLFWKDLTVEVFFNNVQVYKSKADGK